MSQNRELPRIASLHGSLINQIAAGEVIERPSSVVKELVENAIDSGATKIEVHVERGGAEKILIRDNGCGIHPNDLELAIQRHTTSKLRDQDGLNAINSLGFRGEALSSIASISEFSITSRISSEENAMRLEFDPYTSNTNLLPAAANIGTSVDVIKLFQPVPARRKFLRSAKTEYLHILELLKRFVLSQCHIDFYLYNNKNLVLSCRSCKDDYSDRLSTIFGTLFYKNAWFIDNSIAGIRVWGWVGNEKTFRSQSDRQYLFLNNRIIKDKHINHAVRMALDELVHESRYPSYILYVEVDPSTVDVNVHPTKQEVRFRTPRTIHDFIYAVISDVVRQHRQSGALLISDEGNKWDIHENAQQSAPTLMIKDHMINYQISNSTVDQKQVESSPIGSPVMLLSENILITRYAGGFRLVDFYNLRKYFLYTVLAEEIKSGEIKSRPLLVPVALKLNDKKIDVVLSCQESLLKMGFDTTQSGPLSITVRSIPTLLPAIDIDRAIQIFIKNYHPGSAFDLQIMLELVGEMIEISLADSNEILSMDEVKVLLKQFKILDLPFAKRNVQGYWKTMTNEDLKKIIHNGN